MTGPKYAYVAYYDEGVFLLSLFFFVFIVSQILLDLYLEDFDIWHEEWGLHCTNSPY